MNDQSILNTLNRWLKLLRAMDSLPVCFTDDPQMIDARILERQQIIDSLQVLDGQLTEIRALRALKWENYSPQSVEKFESMIKKGNMILGSCARKDQESLDIATSLRKEVSGSISNIRKSKGYLVSSHMVKKSSSIIVDSHA